MKAIGEFIVEVLVGLVVALAIFAIAIPIGMAQAYVLMSLWGWFVVPLGVAALGFWHAFGLSILIHFVQKQNYVSDEESVLGKVVLKWLLGLVGAYGFGYVAHLLMVG